MKQTLQVVRQLMIAYLNVSLTYRADFIQSLINSFMWSGFSFVSAFIITSQTPTVLGLSRADMLLLAAAYGIVVGSFHWIFTSGFRQMPEVFNKGELDGYLLRPIDALLALSLRKISWSSSIRVFASMFLTGAILRHYQIYPSPWQVIGFAILTAFSVVLIYAIYTIMVTALVWNPYLTNITELVNTIVGTARYPLDLNRYTPRVANLIFIPFLLIVNIPVRSLTNRLSIVGGLEYIIFCTMMMVVAKWWWQRSLRSYTSASG